VDARESINQEIQEQVTVEKKNRQMLVCWGQDIFLRLSEIDEEIIQSNEAVKAYLRGIQKKQKTKIKDKRRIRILTVTCFKIIQVLKWQQSVNTFS
jgi:hypothetical protein